jgi:membrane protein
VTGFIGNAWALLKAAAQGWVDDYAPSMGAAIAYYTIFSLAPLLLIVISIAGLVFGENAARGEIFDQLRDILGAPIALAIQGLLESVNKPRQGMVATVVGIVLLLVGATTVFGELQSALDRIWRAPAAAEHSGLWRLLRSRLMSFVLILATGLLLVAMVLVSTLLSSWQQAWGLMSMQSANVARILELLLGFVVTTVVFAMIYKLMPRVRIHWKDVWIGAIFTSVLFTIGRHAIGLYIRHSGVSSGFGAAASLVGLLVWVYYSAQIFLLGAEFTWAYAHAAGSRRSQAPQKENLAESQTAAPRVTARLLTRRHSGA